MTVEGFYQCIRDQNIASLVKVPGVGQKTAELLLLKMKDRLPESLETERGRVPGALAGRRRSVAARWSHSATSRAR